MYTPAKMNNKKNMSLVLKEQPTNLNHVSSSSQPWEIAQPNYIDTNPCEITNGDSVAPALYTDKRKEKKTHSIVLHSLLCLQWKKQLLKQNIY